MLYSIYLLSLLCFVFCIPALALSPGMLREGRTVFMLPILSALLAMLLVNLLLQVGLFSSAVVRAVLVFLAGIACYRVYQLRSNWSTWPEGWWWVLFINVLIVLPYMVRLGSTAFDSGDEIYSWNVWAVRYFSGFLDPDFWNTTQAPYPQLYPKVLALSYQWLGSLDLQLPIKASLAIFPWVTLSAIASVQKRWKAADLIRYTLVTLVVLYAAGVSRFFDDAYADPLMTAALMASISMTYHALRTNNRTFLLWALVGAVVAAYAKQPGMIWSMVGFPLTVLCLSSRQQSDWLVASLSVAATLVWLLGQGSGFSDNGGVLNASFAGRGYIDQLCFSIDKYFIHNPTFGLLALATLLSARKNRFVAAIVCFWWIPSLIGWFLFGAYHLRLGQHVIWGSLLCWAIADYPGLPNLQKYESWRKPLLGLLLFGTVLGSWINYQRSYLHKIPETQALEAGSVALAKYFGAESQWVFKNLYNNPDILLWVTTDYTYGLFYPRTPQVRGNYDAYDPYRDKGITSEVLSILADELKTIKPDFVFSAGTLPVRGHFLSLLLEHMVQQPGCSPAFSQLVWPPNRYDYSVYRFQAEALQERCWLSGE